MCNKNTAPDPKPSSMINKGTTVSLKSARKTRTKTRKPKFLSLRLDISPESSQQSSEMTHDHHQLKLFPLHPENLVEDKDMQDENMAYFFDPVGGATLTGLLDVKNEATTIAGGGISSEEDSISPSLTYAYWGQDSEEGGASRSLVRAALRSKERDSSEEEKWVCYSEVTSCAADVQHKNQMQGLLLKLDYQEVLNAWSDKAPLFIQGDSPQTVPDVHDDANALMEGWGSVGNAGLGRVPEMEGNVISSIKMEETVGGRERWKTGQREASVLRYKEKRQSRLFSKRIRYEVRKLNAEKRPRMKGRFVKRNLNNIDFIGPSC